jgi:hypothetical protein
MEAKKMKVFGTVRTRGKKPYVMKMRQTPTKLREAPNLSTCWRVARSWSVRFMLLSLGTVLKPSIADERERKSGRRPGVDLKMIYYLDRDSLASLSGLETSANGVS